MEEEKEEMNIFPKINIGKLALRAVLLIVFIFFSWLIYQGVKWVIFSNFTHITIYEKDFLFFCLIPGLFCFLIGAVWVSSLKAWDINDCVNKISNRLEAVKLKVFVDELVKEKGWEPIGSYTIVPEKPEKIEEKGGERK